MSNTKKLTIDSYNRDQILSIPVIKNNYNNRESEEEEYQSKGENNFGESMTIQGEAYTIRELLKKHTSGTMPDVMNEGIYLDELDHDSLDFNQFKNLDLSEQQQYRDNQKEYIKQLNKTIKESEKSLLSQEQKQKTENTPKKEE